jgi:transposase-like protein
MGTRRVYSEAFKLHVLRELEEGKFATKDAARRAYGIRGCGTLLSWIDKYGKTHLRERVVRVERPKEVSEVKRLRKRVRDLEKALANANIDATLSEAYLEIACELAGIEDVEGFKKKHAGTS